MSKFRYYVILEDYTVLGLHEPEDLDQFEDNLIIDIGRDTADGDPIREAEIDREEPEDDAE